MEDFPFNINLNYKVEDYIIKPPPNFLQLKEIASKKYDIKIEEMVHITENGEEMVIKNDQDYADLIDYSTNNNLKEVDIVINREKDNEEEEENEEEENENEGNRGNGGNGSDEIGMNCDYDDYGDTRNRKGNDDDEKYNKHNKGFKEKKRIGYIIEKKQMQREETLKNKKNRGKKKK